MPEPGSKPKGEKGERNLLLSLAYDGTTFCGWQVQPQVPTVQGAVERALETMEGQAVRVRSSGRTDTGVHACGLPVNFYTSSSIPKEGYQKGLNSALPPDVAVQGVTQVPLEFDARRWHCTKTYRFLIDRKSVV